MNPDVEGLDTPWGPAGFPIKESTLFAAFGSKGSGKTTAGHLLYSSWEADKLTVDPSGDIKHGPDATVITQIPAEFPARGFRNEPIDLYYMPDSGAPTYFDDLDRAVGLALYPKNHHCLGWFDEIQEFTTGNKTGPCMRRLLGQSRHYLASAIMTGPRPMDIDRLVISQADYLFVFDMPDPDDRARVAKIIGYPAVRFAAECDETFDRGPFWYLFWDRHRKRLYRCPPFPKEWVDSLAA